MPSPLLPHSWKDEESRQLFNEVTKDWPWWATRTMQNFGKYLTNTSDEEEAFHAFTSCFELIHRTDNYAIFRAIEVDSIVEIHYAFHCRIIDFTEEGISYWVDNGSWTPLNIT